MDTQSEKAPSLHLPKPSTTEGLTFYGKYEDMPQKPEFGASAPEASGNGLTASAAGSVAPPTMAVPTQAVPTVPAQQQQPIALAAGDDSQTDDLDKEWIDKAKMIVERTKDDPYHQSSELGKVKADYLRVRYNKHIKVGQDQTL